MRVCRVCGKKISNQMIPIKVVIRASFFDRRKMWFHAMCFLENEQLVKELMAGRKKV